MMTGPELRDLLAGVPDAEVTHPPEVEAAIEDEVRYLASDAALASLATDAYWPKWRSPWWSMLLLHELGETARIPAPPIAAMVEALAALPIHTFPLRDEDWPPGLDKFRASSCHCALGCMDPLLAARGVDVDHAMPWVPAWYARYQMADGGYNCDESAYLVADECPSSMVGTVPVLEALTRRGPSELAERAAGMLIARELHRGSPTQHNAAEQTSAVQWAALCFPRFYFYDVLRGTTALVRWATVGARKIPLAAIETTVANLVAQSRDGLLRIGRVAFADKKTWAPDASGTWARRSADSWPLLLAVSRVGAPSRALTRQWATTRRELLVLIDRDLVA
ncbi:MAG: hypothetical protein WKG01_02095 [Kofleriaceae bacterium]